NREHVAAKLLVGGRAEPEQHLANDRERQAKVAQHAARPGPSGENEAIRAISRLIGADFDALPRRLPGVNFLTFVNLRAELAGLVDVGAHAVLDVEEAGLVFEYTDAILAETEDREATPHVVGRQMLDGQAMLFGGGTDALDDLAVGFADVEAT